MRKKISLPKFLLIMIGIVNIGLTFILLNSTSVSALTYRKYQRVDFTFNSAIKINLSSNDIIIPGLAPGTSSDSNIVDIDVSTNTLYGFKLSASVGDSARQYQELKNTNDSQNTFSPLTSAKASLDNNFGDNKWGYAYAVKDTSNSTYDTWSSYNGLPLYSDTNNVAELLNITKTLATAEVSSGTVGFKIGAKASTSQASGEYTNVINFKAVTNIITTNYTLSYIDNSGESQDIPTGITTPVTITDDTPITLSSTTPTRTGYTFTGWCSVSTNDDTCSGQVYDPGDTYTVGNVGGTLNISLYAIWKSSCNPSGTTIGTNNSQTDILCMQDITSTNKSSILASMNGNTQYTLLDARDEQEYTVAKLADGKIWMTKDLNIAGGTELSYNNTDFESSYTLPTTDGWTVSDGKLVLPTSAVKNDNDNDLTDNTQFSNSNYAYLFNSGNTTNCGASGQNIPCYSYYSWDAATLGSGRSINTNNTEAPHSICPKGWKLPNTYDGNDTEAGATDYRALITAYGGSDDIQTYDSSTTPTGATLYNAIKIGTMPNFLLSGSYQDGSFKLGGQRAYYWSSTSGGYAFISRFFYFRSALVETTNFGNRGFGQSVRCLVK